MKGRGMFMAAVGLALLMGMALVAVLVAMGGAAAARAGSGGPYEVSWSMIDGGGGTSAGGGEVRYEVYLPVVRES